MAGRAIAGVHSGADPARSLPARDGAAPAVPVRAVAARGGRRPRASLLVLAAAAVLHAGTAAAAAAQAARGPRSLEVSVAGGVAWSSDWSDLVVLGSGGGVVQRVLLADLAVDPAPALAVGATYWEGRYGFRVQATRSESCLNVGPGCAGSAFSAERRAELELPGEVGVTAWLFDAVGLIRVREPRPGQRVRPYVVAGLGGALYDVDGSARHMLPTFVDLGGLPGRLAPDEDGRLVLVADDGPFLVAVDEPGLETSFGFVLGLGTDLRLPLGRGGVSVRLEATDHVIGSPLEVRLLGLVDDFGFDHADARALELEFGPVHNLRVAAGVTVDVPLER